MTIELSHEQLLSIIPSWYWMVSDRVGEFDEFLLRPMKNMDLIQKETEALFLAKARSDPNGSDTHTSNLIRKMLRNLEKGGEDVARIYEWGRALDKGMIPTVSGWRRKPDGSMVPIVNEYHYRFQALHPWLETLPWWKPEALSVLNRSGPDMRDALYASWSREVRDPLMAFKERQKTDKKAWLSLSDRRSDWDNYLWDQWFQEFCYDPAGVACKGFREMRTREWWREISPTISQNQKAQMMRWHEELACSRGRDGFLSSDQFGWLDDALLIDVIPPFYKFAVRQDNELS